MSQNPDTPISFDAEAAFFQHIEGHCLFEQLDFALQIHTNDSLERQTTHEKFTVPPRLTVALILEGDLDAMLDDNPLVMTACHGAMGYLWVNRQPACLDRWLRRGQRVRKVIVNLPINQVAVLFNDNDTAMQQWLREEQPMFSLTQWSPSGRAIRHAEEILSAHTATGGMDKLTASIAALSLLQQALIHCKKQLAHNQSNPPDQAQVAQTQQLRQRDVNRARQIRQYILEHIEEELSIDSLAAQANMSVSTLQRLFKNVYSTTVMEFVRTRRLELARLSLLEEGITVSEAAYQAGYSSVSNFSTAFQREFGYSPSACIREASQLRENAD